MAAVSYSILSGQVLEQVTAGTNAPAAGNGAVEIRIDQTAGVVTDGAYAGGVRPLTKGDVFTLLRILEEYLLRDSNVFPGDNSDL